MDCIVKNKHCVDGWLVKDGHNLGKCKCVKIKAVNKAYESWGKFDGEMKQPFSKLEDNNVRAFDYFRSKDYGEVRSYKGLGRVLVDNIPALIKKKGKIVIFGNPGTGKSQFVSSVAFESAFHHEICSYYLKSRELYDAVFDYGDREKKKWNFIQARVMDPMTKVLVIDDLGSELAKGDDNRIFELLTKLNNLLRDFQESKPECAIIITTNLNPEQLHSCYNGDKRVFDMIYQQGKTKFYEFSSKKKFRHSDKDELDFLN